MPKTIGDPEFNSVILLSSEGRYKYFVKQIVDWQEAWGLRSTDGWAIAGDGSGGTFIPIWPHERFAGACATNEWQEYRPSLISLDDWMTRWLPGIAKDGKLVAVFPIPQERGIVVTSERLRVDLENEMEKYEE